MRGPRQEVKVNHKYITITITGKLGILHSSGVPMSTIRKLSFESLESSTGERMGDAVREVSLMACFHGVSLVRLCE